MEGNGNPPEDYTAMWFLLIFLQNMFADNYAPLRKNWKWKEKVLTTLSWIWEAWREMCSTLLNKKIQLYENDQNSQLEIVLMIVWNNCTQLLHLLFHAETRSLKFNVPFLYFCIISVTLLLPLFSIQSLPILDPEIYKQGTLLFSS